MKKRIFAAMLALCLVFSAAFCVSASAEDGKLRFDENGEFKILHICDCQDNYPAHTEMLAFLDTVLKKCEPDLVILGGDNTVDEAKTKELAVEELVKPFVENEVYFTLVFGNHDREQGVDNDALLKMYQKYGGEYCLAYDAVEELSGTGNHYLPIYTSKGSEMKFNLWMFDSGSSIHENGEWLGYDSVREDQIEWYESESKKLVDGNGKMVNSLAFQHIIVSDVYDEMFVESPFAMGEITREFNGKIYSFLPKTHNFSGFLGEYPCPGYINYGQLDAMAETGNVLGIFSGHDHINDFELEMKGIRIINTPGASVESYGYSFTRGARLLTIKEEDTSTFESELIRYTDLAIEDPDFAEAAGISKIEAIFSNLAGDILVAFGKISSIFSAILYW